MPVTELVYDEKTYSVTQNMKAAFDRDGAIIVRNFLDAEEIQKLLKAFTNKDGIQKHAFSQDDGVGRSSRLALWNQPGTDVSGMLARSEKVVGTCEQLLGGEVYHYHSKVMMKDAKVGGTHLWHQDYGYWYLNSCLFPNMMTAYMALDKCVEENGCLQALLGTNRCGRIEHGQTHPKIKEGQVVANDERLKQIKQQKEFEFVHVELNPGDCLFFHCNVLHTAPQNDSDLRRWAVLCCYNRADNEPVKKQHYPNYIPPGYSPITKVPNSAIKECTNFNDLSGKEFF